MKVYIVDDTEIAMQLCQLLKLNAECAKLHWSRTIKDIPSEVRSSLETIESYIEAKVYENCSESNMVGVLSNDEEAELMMIIRKNTALRSTLGTGVIMAGKQAEDIKNMISGLKVPAVIADAISTGKNVVLF